MAEPAASTRAAALERYERALEAIEPPFAFVDMDALRSNASLMLGQAGGKPIRVASKSVRSLPVLRRILALDPGFQGILAFTLPEALHLTTHGIDDVVVAYPTVDRQALRELARLADERAAAPVPMVDAPGHLELIAEAGARDIAVCLDLDAGWSPAGRLHIGPRRSPVRSPEHAVEMASQIESSPATRLVGLMAYEGQVAGVGDVVPRNPLRSLAVRAMQAGSMRDLRSRRAAIVEAVVELLAETGGALELVNAGGTGSLSRTGLEAAVTELTAGSGFYAPHLFDNYRALSLTPAAFFCLPITRKHTPETATALGGGYVASGPAGADRLPIPWLPEGLELDKLEGAGEVQTPLLGRTARTLAPGDRVYMRHAKAGELAEHFDRLYLVEGEEIVDEVPTYRGDGLTFL